MNTPPTLFDTRTKFLSTTAIRFTVKERQQMPLGIFAIASSFRIRKGINGADPFRQGR
jgi:hypothetical protein